MAKQAALLQSFNAGEWSPLMSGRVDLDKFRASCKTMRNFMPSPQGAAVARNGTAYVVPAAYSETTSALLPFQFSTIQSCILEFADKLLRFITEDGLLTSADGSTYQIATPYAAADTANIRYAQKNDIIYLFCAGYPVYKLSRLASTNWTLAAVNFTDGPYLDINYAANRAVPQSIGGTPALDFTWTPTVNAAADTDTSVAKYDQTGTATWQFAEAVALTGYQITLPENNSITYNSTVYSSKDMAPSTWTLSGSNDNSAWTVLDTKTTYVDYENNATDWLYIYSEEPFKYYKLEVTQTYINQTIAPNIGTMLFTSTTDAPFTVNFDNTTNINFGAGFKSGDVGRTLRLQRSDGNWTAVRISAVLSATSVACVCTGMPLLDTTATTFWRLGIFCDTNGYPTCGTFYAERLFMAGVTDYPDTVIASEVGNYESMQPNDPRTYAVTDSDAINVTLESRSAILWMNADDRGVVMGTAAGEWTIQSGGYQNYTTASDITPTSLLARSPTQRGSANVDAVRIDHQVLHVQRSGRQVRAMAYSFEIDGYSSTSLSTQASHLGQPSIVRMAYQSEPYSNVWFVREDGILIALTYMVDQQVEGWSQHDVGGVVESCAVIPSPDSQQDTLWLVVRRTVNGQTVRYIERMLRLWDFDMDQYDAAFVDCCNVDTSLSQTASGFSHLAGEEVYGLIDGKTVFGPVTVSAAGTIALPAAPTKQVIAGLGITAEMVTQRLEAGAQNGTAQGKTKRIEKVVVNLWATGAGNVGVPANVDHPQDRVTPLQLNAFYGAYGGGPLYTFQYPFILPPGYDKQGCLLLSKKETDLLPFNVVSITAFVDTQDAG